MQTVRGAGYRSSVCSTSEAVLGDEEPGSSTLGNLTSAIDELAEDSRGGTSSAQLADRIAGLWRMVSDLDPELDRRRAAYERTADTPESRHAARPDQGHTACPTSPAGL